MKFQVTEGGRSPEIVEAHSGEGVRAFFARSGRVATVTPYEGSRRPAFSLSYQPVAPVAERAATRPIELIENSGRIMNLPTRRYVDVSPRYQAEPALTVESATKQLAASMGNLVVPRRPLGDVSLTEATPDVQ